MTAGESERLDAQVAIVGAGPVGMTLAARLAQRGVDVLLLEQEPVRRAEGSRALCMQRETLEIWARLGIGEEVARRGVQWSIGRTYFRGRELFSVELPGGEGEHFPAFVNISQTEVEELLMARLAGLPGVDLRMGHRLIGLGQDSSGVRLTCEADGGRLELRAAYLVGADGAHSGVRHALGMGFPGHSFGDQFLICDIRAELPFPNERRFFFDPPWNPGRQVLIHPQPDSIWRIDWQIPPGSSDDRSELDRRIRSVIGTTRPFELVWHTVYRFHQRLVERFRIGHVFLAGDAAHLMSPFGARGLNSGVADAENLAWKLALVLNGSAPEELLESYHVERRAAALENLSVTDATMRFMVPHGRLSRGLRNAILRGSVRFDALRRRVNSGRLAQPFSYAASPIISGATVADGVPAPGEVAPDGACVTVGRRRTGVTRLRDLLGDGFVALLAIPDPETAARAAVRASRLAWPAPTRIVAIGPEGPIRGVTVLSASDELHRTYTSDGARAWLIRPDGHIAATLPLDAHDAVDRLADLAAVAIGSTLNGSPRKRVPGPMRRGWRRPSIAGRRRVPRRAA